MNELIVEITKIALEKNKRNKNTIFISYHGHVNLFEIRIYKDGWNFDEDWDYEKRLYLDRDETVENIKKLAEILEYIKELED